LRCGHRFLPDHLEQEPLPIHKKKLWKQMPQNWDGIYDYKGRDEFFKQGVFVPFSEEFMQEIGLLDESGTAYLCFLANRENTVCRLNCYLQIPGSILGS
jgi:hypothetical protein